MDHCPIVPQYIDDVAEKNPDQTWVIAPRSSNLKDGWKNISFGELARAVNGTVHWLHKNVLLGDSPEIITYMGVQDERYAVVLAAVIKSGHKIMLTSPRNSVEGELALLKKTECRTIIHSEGFESTIDPLKKANPDLNTPQLPSFDELLRIGNLSESEKGYFSTRGGDSALVLHTSGSTGLPKPIFVTNTALAMVEKMAKIEFSDHRENPLTLFCQKTPMFTVLPFFHTIGVVTMMRSIFNEAPLILAPVGRPMNAQVVQDIMKATKPEQLFLAPSIIEDLSNDEEGLSALSQAKVLFYGGAPLSLEAGDKVNQVVTIVNILGSTETWSLPCMLVQDKADWSYFEFSNMSGVVFEPQGDSTYEMVIKRNKDITYQAVFANFPDLDEWRTKDLFVQHPSKPKLFQFVGRKDDVIVLNNGEKFNPVDLEKSIESDSLVHGAMVVGEGRFQAGLVLEPRWQKLGEADSHDIIDLLWPAVERANKAVANHGKVWKSKILITTKDKPFKRADKGSIMRRATNLLYQQEIEALYSNEGYGDELGTLHPKADLDEVKTFIRKACNLTFENFQDDVLDETDFFSLGTDSLQVLGLSSAINHALETNKNLSIRPKDIYNHPTIATLSNFIATRHSSGDDNSAAYDRNTEITELVQNLTEDFPVDSFVEHIEYPRQRTVLLTGSTGALGSFILRDLNESDQITKVYALNRSEDAQSRQLSDFKRNGIDAEFSKVTFLQASFGEHQFGLSDKVYETLLKSVDIVIHNAWAVDFNKTLQSYREVHIAGVQHFIDFSIKSSHRAQILFISSVAAIGAYQEGKVVPEKVIEDPSVALPQGYGESKYVSERILAVAAERSGVPVTIVRSGQLAGAVEGSCVWNRQEWVPSLIATSKAMGIIPETLASSDVIDWVPIDLAAKIVIQLSESRLIDITSKQELLSVYNMVNPNQTQWDKLLPTLQEGLGQPKLVTYDEWVDKLLQVPRTAQEAVDKPGIKLAEYYDEIRPGKSSVAQMATSQGVLKSETLRQLKAIDGPLIKRWLDQWQF